MEIKVFGPGCARCEETKKIVSAVIEDIGSNASVEKVTDLQQMMMLGIISTPAVTVNGKLVCSGRVPTKNEVKMWITMPNMQVYTNQAGNCCCRCK